MVAEKVFAVIAESTRRDILEALAQESKAVGQLVDELGVSQPTVSKHLRVLREAGVVTMRAQGQKRYYGINTEPLALVSTWLESLGAGAVSGAATGTAAQTVPSRQLAAANAVPEPPARQSEPEKLPVAASPKNGQPVRVAAAAAATATTAAAKANAAQANGAAAASSDPTVVPAVPAMEAVPASVPARDVVPVAASAPAVSNQVATIVQSNENEGGVQGQISRSVGRAANKAADLLANLPTLPTFRRRKD